MRERVPQLVAQSKFTQWLEIVRLNDGRFHVIRRGAAPMFLCASDSMLVSGPFADLLRERCASSADFVPAAVVQIATGESWPSYFECRPHHEVTPEEWRNHNIVGDRLWHWGSTSLLVSPDLIDQIETHTWSASLRFLPEPDVWYYAGE